MKPDLKKKLVQIAKEKIPRDDVSHDYEHAARVLASAERIAKDENADLDVVIPAALFHDVVVYPKNHPDKHLSQVESAEMAAKILGGLGDYPKDKIADVRTCIMECSFSKGLIPKLLESKILQDSDGLEATGAISIMRTYSSTGQMKRPFYDVEDPFCIERKPDASINALDLFYVRLLKVGERMHTKMAKRIAKRRTDFLRQFLAELKMELDGK
jgi:uncharacterized protein